MAEDAVHTAVRYVAEKAAMAEAVLAATYVMVRSYGLRLVHGGRQEPFPTGACLAKEAAVLPSRCWEAVDVASDRVGAGSAAEEQMASYCSGHVSVEAGDTAAAPLFAQTSVVFRCCIARPGRGRLLPEYVGILLPERQVEDSLPLLFLDAVEAGWMVRVGEPRGCRDIPCGPFVAGSLTCCTLLFVQTAVESPQME